ncbi:MAG: hypothetical protein AB2L14_25475 [Candidatus Xenobiia bacterium LiM19]
MANVGLYDSDAEAHKALCSMSVSERYSTERWDYTEQDAAWDNRDCPPIEEEDEE